ncbi:MAG: diaminopimelate epimerase, partial [Clostridia bacterium]|nr:diaminopimelate epimerase [Clostridia bacterium]
KRMKVNFVKMQAAGNDYIYFERKDVPVSFLPALSKAMSDRHKGVGADGIVVLEKAKGGILFKMFNADGSEGKICGNGIRSAAAFAVKYMGYSSPVKFFTPAGERTVELRRETDRIIATARMGRPKVFLTAEFFAEKLQEVDLYVNKRDIFAINAGNEHAVLFSGLPLSFAAKKVCQSGVFDGGVNLECVSVVSGGIRAEVYERGSGETLSCGSGAVAVAYAAVLSGRAKENEFIKVFMPGGTLEVKIENGEAVLRGEVEEVFRGEYEI